MAEYKINNATVRIFGSPQREKLEAACKNYLRGVDYELISSSGRRTETDRRETELRSVLGYGLRKDFRRLGENA